MKLKEGVVLAGLKLPMRKVLVYCDFKWKKYGQELVVTSGLEGEHSPGSLHYYGYAVDLRTNYFDPDQVERLYHDLLIDLPEQYRVIKESNHIHIDYFDIIRGQENAVLSMDY